VTLPQNHVQRLGIFDLNDFELHRNISHGILLKTGSWKLESGY
jgi:hypothetical protein